MFGVFRILFYPIFVAGSLVLHLFLIHRFPDTPPIILASPGMMLGVLLILGIEQIAPYRKEWNRIDGDLKTDFVLTNLMFPVLIEGIELGMKWIFGEYGVFQIWPRSLPLLVQLPLALLLAEFFFYWTHRFGHEKANLWRFHKVHHSAHRVYWMNSARFHPVDLVVNFLLYFLPLALMGASSEVFALLFSINAATGLLEHANIDFEAGWLNRIFNTAQLHRWHHSLDEKISQTNYGKVLSIWDQVFGTYYLPADKTVGETGVMERGERMGNLSLLAALKSPFI